MRPCRPGVILALVAFAVLAVAAGLWWPGAPFSGDGDGGTRQAGGAAPGGAGRGGGRGGSGGRARETLVVTRPVVEGTSGDRLRALGDAEAVASVSVRPESGGIVEEVTIGSGARVEAGELLVRLDTEAETIARDLAARVVEDAEAALARQAALRRSRAGAEADFDAADDALARARLALRDAALALERRSVRAPIDGVVGLVAVERGDRVGAESEIVTIDDRSTLRVDFRVPERFAPRVSVGQRVAATAFALPGRALEGVVSAVGSRVERDSRTLLVQATIDNADDALRPGMSFSVTARFPGETYPAVDPLAIQWDSDGAYVWRASEGRATRVPVRIVRRNPESVLVAAELAPGDEVVTEGVLSLREGAAVRVAGAPRGAAAASSGADRAARARGRDGGGAADGGRREGTREGSRNGARDGARDGTRDGTRDGARDGVRDGARDGVRDGVRDATGGDTPSGRVPPGPSREEGGGGSESADGAGDSAPGGT